MKAAVVDKTGPPDALHIKDVPVPTLARDHVLIALEYAGVGIWDAEQRAGSWGTVKPGTILGADGSGTIAAVGSQVAEFSVGDRVYSYSYGNSSGGFYAEYVSVPADRVGHVPKQLEMKVAGGMPCVALTALAGLEALNVRGTCRGKDRTTHRFVRRQRTGGPSTALRPGRDDKGEGSAFHSDLLPVDRNCRSLGCAPDTSGGLGPQQPHSSQKKA
jgi:NADPH:quinone reductase-like Zn-dependent oxidoreductase